MRKKTPVPREEDLLTNLRSKSSQNSTEDQWLRFARKCRKAGHPIPSYEDWLTAKLAGEDPTV